MAYRIRSSTALRDYSYSPGLACWVVNQRIRITEVLYEVVRAHCYCAAHLVLASQQCTISDGIFNVSMLESLYKTLRSYMYTEMK